MIRRLRAALGALGRAAVRPVRALVAGPSEALLLSGVALVFAGGYMAWRPLGPLLAGGALLAVVFRSAGRPGA